MINERENLIKAMSVSFSDAVQGVINRSCIIDYGIVKEVVTEDGSIVTVEVSVASDTDDIKVMTCVLANIASKSFTVNVHPEAGDKVIVFYPKRYSEDMFDTAKEEVIIDEYAQGYNMFSGIAVLMNQFKTDGHKNFIDINGTEVSVNLAYSENDSKNNLTLTVDENGKVVFKNPKVEIDVQDDGVVKIDNGKATVTIDSNGDIKINTQGKYEFKNNSTDLKAVIDGLATELENLTTVGSPATQATSPASKATIATWRSTKLNLLM